MKIGSVVIVVGRMGEGKTPFIKALINTSGFRNVAIFDKRAEYPANYTLFFYFTIFKGWLTKFKGTFIVVEEATCLLSAFKDMELEDLITGVQHNKNILLLTFHSLLDIPPYILRKSNYVVLFNTNDEEAAVKSARGKLYRYFLQPKRKNEKGWNIPIIVDYNNI